MSEEETKQRKRLRTPNNRTTSGFRVSNELWAVLQPLLPMHLTGSRFTKNEGEPFFREAMRRTR